jgi:hypothetical protein
MRAFIILVLLMLTATPGLACMCLAGIESLSEDEAGHARAVQIVKRQVLAAEEILRVRVVRRSESGNARTYAVQVQETLKPRRTSHVNRVLATGPDSCQLDLMPNKEWLLFVNAGRLSQCSGSSLLGNAKAWDRVSATEAARMNDWYYKVGARTLELVRTVLATEQGR